MIRVGWVVLVVRAVRISIRVPVFRIVSLRSDIHSVVNVPVSVNVRTARPLRPNSPVQPGTM
jgi:hypothetical protein